MGGLRRPLRSKVLPSGNVCLHSGSSCALAMTIAAAARTARSMTSTNVKVVWKKKKMYFGKIPRNSI